MLIESGQLIVFAQFLFFGIVAGVSYSVVWITKLILGENKITCFVFDVLFFLIAGVEFVLSALLINSSNLRLFMIVAFCLGLISYLAFVQRHFTKLYLRLVDFFKNLRKKTESCSEDKSVHQGEINGKTNTKKTDG